MWKPYSWEHQTTYNVVSIEIANFLIWEISNFKFEQYFNLISFM